MRVYRFPEAQPKVDGPWRDEPDKVVDVEVHGGLTFADKCQEGSEEGLGICHVPEPGRPADMWWLGFDCAHAWDLVPGMQEIHAAAGIDRSYRDRDVYRDFAYVKAEVERLAEQLAVAQGADA